MKYSTTGIEAMLFWRPTKEAPYQSLSFGAGVGRYTPAISGNFETYSSTKYGLVLGGFIRPVERDISLELGVSYRFISDQDFGPVDIIFQDDVLDTLQSGKSQFGGISFYAGIGFRLGSEPRFE